MIEKITQQIEPERIPILLISIILLTLLASYLYIFKKPLTLLEKKTIQLEELYSSQVDINKIESKILTTENEIKELENLLNSENATLNKNELITDVMKEMYRISMIHEVNLTGLNPGDKAEYSSYQEIPFSIEVNGTYQNLYAWLNEIETKLPHLIIKNFKIRASNEEAERTMQLTLVSYNVTG